MCVTMHIAEEPKVNQAYIRGQTRRLGWLSSRSARSKTLSVLEPCEGILGVLGTVAWAAAPRAALSGVAGTGVLYPPEL